ncbi:MAG: MMPL family transporter [Planctomycetaceae bacterium]|nr:MMPL family transporter [Planctomycetaceae bacterium]
MVDHPWLVGLLILTLSGFALLGYVAPEKLTKLFETRETQASESPPASKPSQPVPDVDAVQLTGSDVILVVESDDIFTPDGAEALRDIVDALEHQDYIDRVFWMDRVPVLNVFGLRESLFPRSNASERQFEAAREKAIEHPLVGGQLLSRDGRTVLMLIHIDWLFVEQDEDCTDRIKTIAQEAASHHPEAEFSFLVTGRVPIYLTFMEAQRKNRWNYQVIGYVTVFLMALFLFRGLRAVMIVSLAPCLGVFWSLGILHYLDLQDNPFNDVVLPVLLSLVALTDGVHLMVEIRRQRGQGLSTRDAARAGICKVGLACGLTSLTTAIGFGSLSLAHHEIVREFGWSCVLGVILTFLAVITVIPLACSTWLGSKIHLGQEKALVNRHLNRIGGIITFVLRRRKLISVVGVLTTFLFGVISLTLRPDERRTNALPSNSEAAIAIDHMDEAFGGLEMGYVEIHWAEDIPENSAEILTAAGEVNELLSREDLISSPLSIKNFVDVLPGEGPLEDRMPLVELMPPPLKRAFYEPERRRAVVNFRVRDLGIAQYGPVFQRIQAGLKEIEAEHPKFQMQLAGSPVRRWENLYQIVVDLAMSLGSASVIIFLTLTLAYRSLRLGLISVIPNLFPLAVTGTFLVISGQALELASVCAFTVCLGIAVDDTIHFLTRYREELRTAPIAEAIERAFTGTGTALIMTTIVLVVGFGTVMFSDMRDQRIFATMGGLTISSALFGDLVFLPALLLLFGKDEKRDSST